MGRVAVEVHYVVQVARPRAFAERAELFTEGFLISVAIRPETAFGTVCIRMEYFAADGRKHQPLVRREVKLDLRPAAGGRRDRPAESDLALAAHAATWVFENFKAELVGRNVQSRLFRDPGDDFLEGFAQELLVDVIFIAQREIEVFREPIGFEIAFLEAGSALEYPALGKIVVRIDAGKYPAEDIIFLDDVWEQGQRRRGFEYLAAVDHVEEPFQRAGIQRCQAVTRFDAVIAGSSRA